MEDFRAYTDEPRFNNCEKCKTQYDFSGSNIGNVLCSEHLEIYLQELCGDTNTFVEVQGS